MAIVVKCPICGRIKKLDKRTKYFFRCCGVSHPIQPNVITTTWEKPLKSNENEARDKTKNYSDEIEIELEDAQNG